MIEKRKLKRVIKKLRETIEPENVLTAYEDLYCYSYDASWFQAMPDVVVRPHSTDDVVKIVRLANEERIPITPRGGGTNVSGGAVPLKGGIVVDMSGLNKILEIDRTNLRATVEPGVVHTDLEDKLAENGLFWPPDPASGDACQIGGILAECGGGMRALKYGTARDWVLGLEVVLPTGEVIKTGALTLKCVSGLDLTRLFIGSEGTLGIITKAILKVRPLPEALIRMFAIFDVLEAAGVAVGKIFEAGIVPLFMEILDKATIKAVNGFTKLGLPEVEVIMILDVDGTMEECEKLADKIEKIFMEVGAKAVKRAMTEKEMSDLYAARKAAYPALCRLKPTTLMMDIVTPVSKLPEMIREVEQMSKKYDILIATFGHAGDGNLHPTLCVDERNLEEWDRAMKCHDEICRAALKLGGTLTGEHGIGISKARLLEEEYGPYVIKITKAIKNAIDPNNLMNPDKMGL